MLWVRGGTLKVTTKWNIQYLLDKMVELLRSWYYSGRSERHNYVFSCEKRFKLGITLNKLKNFFLDSR